MLAEAEEDHEAKASTKKKKKDQAKASWHGTCDSGRFSWLLCLPGRR